MDAEASKKLDRSLDRDGGIMVYVGEGERGARRARRGWKIEIKGRWVIAVAWEAGQDKSNRTGNRNATPSSDHERKNPHGKSPGINSVPRLEPDWSNSLGATCASFFFYPLTVLFSPYAYTLSLSFFFFLFLDDPRRSFQSSLQPSSNFKFWSTVTMVVGAFSFSLFQSWKGGPVGGHFDRDVQGFARWTKSFMKARRRNWLVYIIDFILFFFQDVRETEIQRRYSK